MRLQDIALICLRCHVRYAPQDQYIPKYLISYITNLQLLIGILLIYKHFTLAPALAPRLRNNISSKFFNVLLPAP